MDRCAVFVDAGYLYGAATNLLTGSHARRALRTDQAGMVKAIRALAESETQLPLLRIYWYDAARNRVPDREQRALANLDDVKLRLGNLRQREDGRFAQKGVDADLHADMTELARNKGAADFVLITGDEDLLRAVDEVQTFGIRVHLWGVDGGSEHNQSLELIGAADRRELLDEAFLRRFFDVLPDRDEIAAGIAEVAAATAAEPDGEAVAGAPENAPQAAASLGTDSSDTGAAPAAAPSPAVLAARAGRAAPAPGPTAAPGPTTAPAAGGRAPEERDYLSLSALTTRAEQAKDVEEDEAAGTVAPFEMGRVYGMRWRARATAFAAEGLRRQRPAIPRAIDGELIAYAQRRGAPRGRDEVKAAVRNGFWSALNA